MKKSEAKHRDVAMRRRERGRKGRRVKGLGKREGATGITNRCNHEEKTSRGKRSTAVKRWSRRRDGALYY